MYRQERNNPELLDPDLIVIPELRGNMSTGSPVEGVEAPKKRLRQEERPIAMAYPVVDTDLGRDNLENDLPAADLEDL